VAEPRRPEALECALRALRHRDRSIHELERRLEQRGFSEPEREDAIETLTRTELLDDHRFAEARAGSLAGRGASDALIRHALGQAGVAADLIEQALQAVPPETERARLIVSRRGGGPRTARYLAGKGFSDEVVAGVVAGGTDDELG
jgi:SOS response regulatory protein OraA/RecX